jgi:2-oxoglutarate ferredoxin oxidoreductase subunit alpha
MVKKYTWKIGGEAGFGIKSAGLSFSKICARAGYEIFDGSDYPSLIRGGHNTYQVTVSDQPVYSLEQQVDLLVALNQNTVDFHWGELNHGAAVIYDKTTTKIPKHDASHNIRLYHVPLKEIIKQADGIIVMRNVVALGATLALMKLPFRLLEASLKEAFASKPKLVPMNVRAAKAGYDYVQRAYHEEEYKIDLSHFTPRDKKHQRLIIPGNEAIALGALAAGCNFYVAYPMTPSSSILHYLAGVAASQKIIVKHAEDEISVINMALGAAHVGARAMIGTSGGGFALMVEALGLTAITETPLVIVEVQRPGPATGLPTWTGQADLQFVLHAAQDEFPRIILAPGDTEECFYLTAQAFNWAEQYQLPVIIRSDKYLAEGYRSTVPFDMKRIKINRGKLLSAAASARAKDFKRFKLTADGVSPRTLPGMKGGEFLANSDEHDEYGFSEESSANRIAQVDKRARKLESARQELTGAQVYGNPKAKKTIVAWGSTKGPILDALATMKHGDEFKLLHLNIIWPFPTEAVTKVLERSKKVILMENNATGQLGNIIAQETGFEIRQKFLKYDGRPLFPEEIRQHLYNL